jgi:hypothetical protein
MRVWLLSALVTGCGGKDTSADSAAIIDNTACRDAWPSAPLGTVPADSWPAGLDTSIPLLTQFDGLWTTQECGDTDEVVDLKIVVPPQDELQVYTTTPDLNTNCGCETDPAFTTDNGYRPVARVDIDVFIEDFADYALNEQNFELPLIFFQDGQDLKARACQRVRIDPDLDDNWIYGTVMIRLEAGGVLSGALVLENGAVNETCDLTQFEGR